MMPYIPYSIRAGDCVCRHEFVSTKYLDLAVPPTFLLLNRLTNNLAFTTNKQGTALLSQQ